MAAHRYWRIRITRGYSANNLFTINTEFRETPGGADVTGGGTAFATATSAGSADNAFDASETSPGGSSWSTSGSTTAGGMNSTLGYDFGAGNEKSIIEFTWIASIAGRNPRDVLLEYSDDGVSWGLQGAWIEYASAAADVVSVYTVAVPLEAAQIVAKAGFNIVQSTWDNDKITLMKAGYQVVMDRPGVVVDKVSYLSVIGPTDGGKVGSALGYVVYEEEEKARVAGVVGYVLYRPIPVPPRKTVLITARGKGFGGSGSGIDLIGTVEQEQDFSATMALPQNLSGVVEQESEFAADLFVDNEVEDVFLLGDVVQTSDFAVTVQIPHNLAGDIDQESEVVADLTHESAGTPQYLEGSIEQINTLEGYIDGVVPHSDFVTIASGTATADLVGFPYFIDLSTMSPAWWENVADDGADIRAYDDVSDPLAFDLISFNKGAQTGSLFVRTDVATASDTVLEIEVGYASRAALSAGDTYGQYAVWADYEAVYFFLNNLNDRTDNARNLTVKTGSASYGTLPLSAGGGLNTSAASFQASVDNAIAASGVFTMAASAVMDTNNSDNQQVMTFCNTYGSSSSRSTLGNQNSGEQWTTYSANDSWLDGGSLTVGTTKRVATTYNGSTNRKLYLDGVLSATDTGIVNQTHDTLVIGGGSSSGANWRGRIGFAYLRLEAMSDAWLAFEADNLYNETTVVDVVSLWGYST